MGVLLLVLLLGLLIFHLGLCVWAIFKHFLTTDIPSVVQHQAKMRVMHCIMLYVISLANILEKMRICSLPRFVRFAQAIIFTNNKDPKVVVTDLHFGTIPVRLFQPKTMSCSPRRGIIFYHGGAGVLGGLDCYHNVCAFLARETDSVLLCVGYRMLPDYHYPVITSDCLNASIHFLKRLNICGVDPTQVVVCGDSIGGGVVAQVTQALVGQKDIPQIRAQVMMYPVMQGINFQLPSYQQNKRVPFFTWDLMFMFICKYMTIDLSWQDAMLKGTFIPPETWIKYRKWLSSDNIPESFKNKYQEPQFPGPFNEVAYLETKHLFDVGNEPILTDDEIVAQLPDLFLVSCGLDILRDDALLYKKRLEDQGVPVSWFHLEDGLHGSIVLFDKQPFSFPCSQKMLNAVVSYIKGL
ncbi:PREDICTED: arylacetamide deacetylase-like 4 [Chinchilla lanigera]|uniref:arylacetamide deacetylase-like 4 n=1 Tax=Chinchilla lanigera TaxID=34839 RepID=UPI00038EA949|nr:PREDICTED: arylacetamide deacetylase-like 4 [Chinchilla lanigera]